ncbi:MAG: hypothetical protein HW402_1100, partial [Dehalococcoidales bacterium]|nr:hypothetical protein [Dehalococcoidales bacterium]
MLLCESIIRTLVRTTHQNHRDIVNYITSQTEMPSWDFFLPTMPDLRKKYWQTFAALHRELVPNHISSQDLYVKLWELFKEVTTNGGAYKTRESLDKKLAEFCELVKKPLQTFDIIYHIKNFDAGNGKFSLGNIEIFKLTRDYLNKLGLNEGASEVQDTIFEEWVDRSIAKTEIDASEIDRAYESGFSKVNSVLDVVRLIGVRERLARLVDEMFLWELGESIVIPRVKPQEGTSLSISSRRGFRPRVVPMDSTINKGLENHGIWQYVLNGNLPDDINTRVLRATKWISHAVTSSSLDHKLVDLST